MTVPLLHVDAFATQPFAGNPAGVCLLPAPREAAWMQAIAAELNLPATAFVTPVADGAWPLRWFSPAVELTLCGHGTLAAAHVLWETGRLARDATARFATAAGSYLSSSDKRLHFGLGAATRANIEVLWPSGIRQQIAGAEIDQILKVQEPKHR